MKRIIASVLAVSAIAAAAPATAQIVVYERPAPMYYDQYDPYPYSRDHNYRGYGQWRGITARINAIDRRIDVGIRNGQITRGEAIRLRAELRNIVYLESRYRRNGLSMWERSELDARLDRLAVRVRMERRDMDRYGFRGYMRY